MNAQISEQPEISLEVTDDGWVLHSYTHQSEAFSFEDHYELMARLIEATRGMAPPVVKEYIEKTWEERARKTVGKIVARARGQQDAPQQDTPG